MVKSRVCIMRGTKLVLTFLERQLTWQLVSYPRGVTGLCALEQEAVPVEWGKMERRGIHGAHAGYVAPKKGWRTEMCLGTRGGQGCWASDIG